MSTTLIAEPTDESTDAVNDCPDLIERRSFVRGFAPMDVLEDNSENTWRMFFGLSSGQLQGQA